MTVEGNREHHLSTMSHLKNSYPEIKGIKCQIFVFWAIFAEIVH